MLPLMKFFSSVHSSSTCSSSYSLYKCILHVTVSVISQFVTPKMTPAGTESSWKYTVTF